MNFYDARAIALATKLHIRRESWPADKWMWVLNTVVSYIFTAEVGYAGTQLVRCTDFGRAEFEAQDWTTMPAPLMSCPITPTSPLGGGPPIPGSPGFPGAPSGGGYGGGSAGGGSGGGGSGGGGGGGGGGSLPPPDPGTSLSVTFAGLTAADFTGTLIKDLHTGDLDGTYALAPAGGLTWSTTFQKGYLKDTFDDRSAGNFSWQITATKIPNLAMPSMPTWHLSLKGIAGKVAPVSGGFEEVTPLPRRSSMNNSIHAAGGNDFFGGTGKVN